MSVRDIAAGNNTLNSKSSNCSKYCSGLFFVSYKNQTAINQSINGTACLYVAAPTFLNQLGNFLCLFKADFVHALIKYILTLNIYKSNHCG